MDFILLIINDNEIYRNSIKELYKIIYLKNKYLQQSIIIRLRKRHFIIFFRCTGFNFTCHKERKSIINELCSLDTSKHCEVYFQLFYQSCPYLKSIWYNYCELYHSNSHFSFHYRRSVHYSRLLYSLTDSRIFSTRKLECF